MWEEIISQRVLVFLFLFFSCGASSLGHQGLELGRGSWLLFLGSLFKCVLCVHSCSEQGPEVQASTTEIGNEQTQTLGVCHPVPPAPSLKDRGNGGGGPRGEAGMSQEGQPDSANKT